MWYLFYNKLSCCLRLLLLCNIQCTHSIIIIHYIFWCIYDPIISSWSLLQSIFIHLLLLSHWASWTILLWSGALPFSNKEKLPAMLLVNQSSRVDLPISSNHHDHFSKISNIKYGIFARDPLLPFVPSDLSSVKICILYEWTLNTYINQDNLK